MLVFFPKIGNSKIENKIKDDLSNHVDKADYDLRLMYKYSKRELKLFTIFRLKSIGIYNTLNQYGRKTSFFLIILILWTRKMFLLLNCKDVRGYKSARCFVPPNIPEKKVRENLEKPEYNYLFMMVSENFKCKL